MEMARIALDDGRLETPQSSKAVGVQPEIVLGYLAEIGLQLDANPFQTAIRRDDAARSDSPERVTDNIAPLYVALGQAIAEDALDQCE